MNIKIKETFKKITLFLVMLIAVYFPLGTFTFVLIIRSLVIFMQQSQWAEFYVHLITLCVILGSLLYSVLFAKWLTIWLFHSNNRADKNFFAAAITIIWVITLSYWIMPRATLEREITSIDGHFTGGPYPDKNQLIFLKANGYTGIISLLDPLVLPAEPWLYFQEKYNAKKIGIKLINIPIVPESIYTLETIKTIEELSKRINKKDKYYVHGYYGQDRVKTFIDIVNANAHLSKNGSKRYLS